jgi:hypothetical protein
MNNTVFHIVFYNFKKVSTHNLETQQNSEVGREALFIMHLFQLPISDTKGSGPQKSVRKPYNIDQVTVSVL